jgi:hypothetical protein
MSALRSVGGGAVGGRGGRGRRAGWRRWGGARARGALGGDVRRLREARRVVEKVAGRVVDVEHGLLLHGVALVEGALDRRVGPQRRDVGGEVGVQVVALVQQRALGEVLVLLGDLVAHVLRALQDRLDAVDDVAVDDPRELRPLVRRVPARVQHLHRLEDRRLARLAGAEEHQLLLVARAHRRERRALLQRAVLDLRLRQRRRVEAEHHRAAERPTDARRSLANRAQGRVYHGDKLISRAAADGFAALGAKPR